MQAAIMVAFNRTSKFIEKLIQKLSASLDVSCDRPRPCFDITPIWAPFKERTCSHNKSNNITRLAKKKRFSNYLTTRKWFVFVYKSTLHQLLVHIYMQQ